MWSPWASGPDGPVDPIWMGIVWRLLTKSYAPGLACSMSLKGEKEGEEKILTPENFAKLSGREEMTENRLRTGQNRFLMHRSYSEECAGQLYGKS